MELQDVYGALAQRESVTEVVTLWQAFSQQKPWYKDAFTQTTKPNNGCGNDGIARAKIPTIPTEPRRSCGCVIAPGNPTGHPRSRRRSFRG